MDTQFKKGVLDICVLAILKKKDHYGYELVHKISKDISITEGTLNKEGRTKSYKIKERMDSL